MSSPYDHLRKVLSDNDSTVEDPYPDLKQLLPVDMVTFAYQIADGMVSFYSIITSVVLKVFYCLVCA